jgi:SAM-dependent methyltransferase
LTINWLDGSLSAVCPVCEDAQPKPRVLEVDTLGAAPRPIVLVSCPGCTLRFFPELGQPASFAAISPAETAGLFEAGIGLRGSIECLARVDKASVRRYLEVGCGTGLTLDWARHVYGWEVLGVDSSSASRLARTELGLAVLDGELGETVELHSHGFDLAFACEVLEHVPDPARFLRAIRRALTPAGVFLLRTPAAESIVPEHDEVAVTASLAPGFHTMLHTRASLDRTLRRAGFTEVRSLRDGDTLHAAASGTALAWSEDATLDPEDIVGYLHERAAGLPVDSAVRLGLLQQLANWAVNEGETAEAHWALGGLDATLRARHGHGVDATADEVPTASASLYCSAFAAQGLLAVIEGDRARAEDRFAAGVEAGERALAVLEARNAFHAGLDETRRVAALNAFTLRARRDPASAVDALPGLLENAGAARPKLVLELFTRAVADSGTELAAVLSVEVESVLAEDAPAGHEAREARWALAMFLLHAGGAPGRAATHFARASREAEDAERDWSARFHEGYARWHSGDRVGAVPILREVVSAPRSGTTAWAQQARDLLAQAG